MTTSEPPRDDLLVNVKAQIMTQNDEIGGWLPMGAGGLSFVRLRRRSINSCPTGVEYLIQGLKVSDRSEVLNCILRTDLLYKNPSPCFHYWKSDERRFGLTFQTPGDADAFHRGVKRAMADMRCGSDKKTNGNGDEDVFMELDLPLGRKDSASTNSTTTSSPGVHSPPVADHLQRIEYGPKPIQRKPSPSSLKSSKSASSPDSREDRVWVRNNDKRPSNPICRDIDDVELQKVTDPYYVQITKPNTPPNANVYSYPALEAYSKGAYKNHEADIQAPLGMGKSLGKGKRTGGKDNNRNTTSRQCKDSLISKRTRCCYCNEMFEAAENGPGSCQDAPDRLERCIEHVSCMWCAQGMLYHCLSDPDRNDFTHPCVCRPQDENNHKKWTALAVLSLFVPCLWCYWPLMACHRCGVSCGCCGGRHRTVNSATLNADLSTC